jgi:branched-chain amino acid transport system ATP-binding protein
MRTSGIRETVANAPVLRAIDIAVHFGGIRAVDGVSFELSRGTILGILGPNGSGKSTMLGALTGLVKLTSGSFSIEGVTCRTNSATAIARLGVARTFQTARLVPGLTVLENVQLAADQPWVPQYDRGFAHRVRARRKAADQLVDAALERTGLNGTEDLRPPELSYGTQRRVEIARALAANPRLLLLDEPTAGMNQIERREIGDLLRKLRSEGLTQLLVEHDVQMMVDTCDRLLVMNFGELIAEGTPTDIVRLPAVREAYLGKRWKDHA